MRHHLLDEFFSLLMDGRVVDNNFRNIAVVMITQGTNDDAGVMKNQKRGGALFGCFLDSCPKGY